MEKGTNKQGSEFGTRSTFLAAESFEKPNNPQRGGKLCSIVGIQETSKFLLKLICREERITQVEWVERHLNEDHKAMRGREGLIVGSPLQMRG